VTKKIVGALLGFGLAATVITGCSNKASQVYNDGSRSGVNDKSPADILAFPDGFSNVATKCNNGNRVYVAFHNNNPYAAIAVVPNDPTCK
jgi:hypothetical protein